MISEVGSEGRGWYGECPQAEEASALVAIAMSLDPRDVFANLSPEYFKDCLDAMRKSAEFQAWLSGGKHAPHAKTGTNTAIERMEREAEAMKAEEARLA